jgi:hypothetical protein
MTHLGLLVLFALLVAAVFGALLGDAPRDELRTGGRIFGGLVLGAWLAGWIIFGAFG